jgi:hypothetical protein
MVGPDPMPNPNRIVASQFVKVFNCPSDSLPGPTVNASPRTATAYEREDTRRSNYLFNAGNDYDHNVMYQDQTGVSLALKGPFGNNGAANMAAIQDGTSNTIAIGESKQIHLSTSYGPYWGAGVHTAVNGRTASTNDPTLPAARCFIPNYPYGADTACQATPPTSPANWKKLQYAWGFGSWHPGTSQFVLCDGSVRGVTDNVTAAVWISLGSISGGEVVSE